MRRWIGLALLAMLLLASAFGLSALATEWRQETADIAPLATQVSGLASDVEEIRSLLQATPTPGPAPTPTPTPEPVVAPLTPGTKVEAGGKRITVLGLSNSRMNFVLEGPYSGLAAFGVKILDERRFLCDVDGIEFSAGRFTQIELAPGEKLGFGVLYSCAGGRRLDSLTLDGIRFESP